MRIFISGPMTGFKDNNAKAFESAAEKFRKEGHTAVNPLEVTKTFGSMSDVNASFRTYYGNVLYGGPNPSKELAECVMEACKSAVRSCDTIYMLEGWENSRGARRELLEALKANLDIVLEKRDGAELRQMTLPGLDAPKRADTCQT
jgi:hypothetical protein